MAMTIDDLRVGNLMSFDPVTIEADDPVTKAEQLLKTYRISGLPVVVGGTAVGVISQTDIVTARSSELIGGNWARLRVRHLMSAPAVTVHVETTVERAARLMVAGHLHRLVVVDLDDRPIGVLSSLDLLRVLIPDRGVA
jgi:CBS domain-containing protein